MKLSDAITGIMVLILIFVIFHRNHRRYKQENLKPGDVIYLRSPRQLFLVPLPYSAMIFPKNHAQLIDFLNRFFLPKGFMNTLGSVAYWLFFTLFPMFMISIVFIKSIVLAVIVSSLIILIPVIIMISTSIYHFIKEEKNGGN